MNGLESPTEFTPEARAHAQAVRSFARSVSVRLLLWSVLSMVGGALIFRGGGPFRRGFGAQAMGWGAVDGLIAGIGLAGQRRARAAAAGDGEHAARKLRRLLWINALLDVCYMAGGVWLGRSKGGSNPGRRGQGWSIVVQGAFLFWFDLYHALRVPRS
jgi:hypothetical protein